MNNPSANHRNHWVMLQARDAYKRRYGQAKGTTDRVATQDATAVATFTFKR